jgi:hypothetical protein
VSSVTPTPSPFLPLSPRFIRYDIQKGDTSFLTPINSTFLPPDQLSPRVLVLLSLKKPSDVFLFYCHSKLIVIQSSMIYTIIESMIRYKEFPTQTSQSCFTTVSDTGLRTTYSDVFTDLHLLQVSCFGVRFTHKQTHLYSVSLKVFQVDRLESMGFQLLSHLGTIKRTAEKKSVFMDPVRKVDGQGNDT